MCDLYSGFTFGETRKREVTFSLYTFSHLTGRNDSVFFSTSVSEHVDIWIRNKTKEMASHWKAVKATM